MIPWMLARLEQNPHTAFTEKELKEAFPEEFQQARQQRLVRRVSVPPSPGALGTYRHPSGHTWLVASTADGYEAFDGEDSEADPVTVSVDDLVLWSIDLEIFAIKLQQANGLRGKPDQLNQWLYFLGERNEVGDKTAYVLALFSVEDIASEQLLMLPGLLPRRHRKLVVLCPGFQPSPVLQRRVEDQNLTLMSLQFQSHGSFALTEFPGQEPEDPDFQYWDSYRTVRWRGQVLTLAPLQAEVVGMLHQAYRTGSPGLSWEAISRRLSGNATRMSDIFKRSDPRSQLVLYQQQGRAYRLTI